ncbi:hypothetical protein DL770_008452 [Monosporascus sp. CRB-9-2]|nr:hypothetical protein DL770_008452 [Monosporascus sp. CRB-9-2]
MPYPDEFDGFMINELGKRTDSKKQTFKANAFGEGDIDIKIKCCGVGHDVVGKAVKVGSKVKDLKVGDRVDELAAYTVQDTYGAPYPKKPTPMRLSHRVDTLLIQGRTIRAGVGKGQQVGIVRLGDLGDFAVLWVSVLGAEVTMISHSPHKKDDVLELGAKHFVCSGKEGWAKSLAFKFNFLLNTADMSKTNFIIIITGYVSSLLIPKGLSDRFPQRPLGQSDTAVLAESTSNAELQHDLSPDQMDIVSLRPLRRAHRCASTVRRSRVDEEGQPLF